MQRRRQQGLQLFEVMLLVSIIGLLMLVSANKILQLRTEVERSAVEQTVNRINGWLATQSAHYIVNQNRPALIAMRDSNPVRLLREQDVALPPFLASAYLGERFGPAPEVIDPGHWVFDQRDKLLIYRLRHPGNLNTPLAGPARLRFRVDIGPDEQQLTLAQLKSVDAYQWEPTP